MTALSDWCVLQSAYAIPTMAFSFLCHTAILPIYCELDRWARPSPSFAFSCSPATHSPCCSCLSGRLKGGCRMLPTSASASASCCTWSPHCLATSPSTVSPRLWLQTPSAAAPPQSLVLLFFFVCVSPVQSSCRVWAAAWLQHIFASGRPGDDGSIRHPDFCLAHGAPYSFPRKCTDSPESSEQRQDLYNHTVFFPLCCLYVLDLTIPQARKAVNLLLFGVRPFSWPIHIITTLSILGLVMLMAIFMPDIRNVFGVVGMWF